MRKSAILVQSVWRLPRVETSITVYTRTKIDGLEGLSRAHELAWLATGLWPMAQHRVALVEAVGRVVAELGRKLTACPSR